MRNIFWLTVLIYTNAESRAFQFNINKREYLKKFEILFSEQKQWKIVI
jgi:hypothetical protein